MKTYLITGCAGFIGSNFVHYMLKKYPEILLVNLDKLTYAGNLENLKDVEGDPRHVFVQGDICDKELVESLFQKYDFDYVINFAAESHVDRSIKNPEIFVQSNVMGTVNLLQRAKEAWYDADAKTWKEGKKYLQVSTDEVYGALGAEGFFMETTPLCPHSPYSSSKASADMFVMAFHDTYGMPINITRCSNNYGPYQFPEKLIPLMINNVKHHKQLPVYGDGMQIRDWLYVMDHCKAIDMVANGGKDGEVYNVGGHNERPNIFIVKTVIAQLHDRLKDEGISEELITHVADRLGHDRRYGIDPTKIKEDLGWYPETPTNYHKYYEGSGIVRCRRGSWSYTILNNSPSFLFFQHGDFTLTVRIGASFCEHRNFVPAALAPKDGGYALHQTMTGWYYLPFAEKPATSDWWQMDNAHREKLYGPDMVFDVQVNEVENGLDIHIVNSGIDRAPLRVELAFNAGCRVENEHFMLEGNDGGGVVVKDGTLVASKGVNGISVGPCFAEHNYTAGKEGSMGRMDGCFTAYLTAYSTFDRTISLRAVPSKYDQA